MITDLPKYFTDVLKFNIKETGLMSALPYIAMYVFSFIFAFFCDFCIMKKWHSIGTGRKIYTTLCKLIAEHFYKFSIIMTKTLLYYRNYYLGGDNDGDMHKSIHFLIIRLNITY